MGPETPHVVAHGETHSLLHPGYRRVSGKRRRLLLGHVLVLPRASSVIRRRGVGFVTRRSGVVATEVAHEDGYLACTDWYRFTAEAGKPVSMWRQLVFCRVSSGDETGSVQFIGGSSNLMTVFESTSCVGPRQEDCWAVLHAHRCEAERRKRKEGARREEQGTLSSRSQ